MSRLSWFLRPQRDRWYRIGIDRRHQVRRQLAYYVARHGFEIGDYSFGAPVVIFFKDEGRLKIGKYCSIAAGATFVLGGNHRTDTITTFPLGRVSGDYRPEEMPKSRGDIVLGSDVWVAANAVISVRRHDRRRGGHRRRVRRDPGRSALRGGVRKSSARDVEAVFGRDRQRVAGAELVGPERRAGAVAASAAPKRRHRRRSSTRAAG